MKPPPEMMPYASGERLRGDDFTPEQIRAWFEQETQVEGYEEKVQGYGRAYEYAYHALNVRHAYRHLPSGRRFENALGLGSYTGEEFAPLADRLGHITVVEPSRAVARDQISGVPATYVQPEEGATLPFPAGHFDYVSCLSTLHHVPNVSALLREMYRVMKPGALLVVREPAISMGDWTRPRPGLTRNERGIALPWMRATTAAIGFHELRHSLCLFPGMALVGKALGFWTYNSPFGCALDHLLCRATAWNLRYWRGSFFRKLAPIAYFMLLQKPGASSQC